MKDGAIERYVEEKEHSGVGLRVRLYYAWQCSQPGVGEREEELGAKRSAARAIPVPSMAPNRPPWVSGSVCG